MRDHVSYPDRAARLVGAVLLATILAAAAAGAALAQAQPKGGARAQGQDVDFGRGAATPGAAPGALADPRQQMRDLVREIGLYTRGFVRTFSVLTVGGLELLETVDAVDPTIRAPATTYMRSIDGLIAREINFHPPRDGREETKTDEKLRAEMLRLADIGAERGVQIWTLDWAKDATMAGDAVRAALAKSFVPLTVADAAYRFDSLPRFPARPVNENPGNVTGVKHVRNYLMLTDSSAWDSQEEVVLALADTNYDAVVVDVFHRGRTPLTPTTVAGLKYKKLGARRLVLAYMNIGEAETYRYYWQPGWREGSPSFIGAPTPGNPDKYAVRYWEAGWRNLVSGNAESYVYGIVAQGYDGVVLDGVEAYRYYEAGP